MKLMSTTCDCLWFSATLHVGHTLFCARYLHPPPRIPNIQRSWRTQRESDGFHVNVEETTVSSELLWNTKMTQCRWKISLLNKSEPTWGQGHHKNKIKENNLHSLVFHQWKWKIVMAGQENRMRRILRKQKYVQTLTGKEVRKRIRAMVY